MERLVLPARVASLAAVAEFTGGVAAAAGLSGKDAYRLRLSVDELVTNVIMHGYPPGSEGQVELSGSARDGQATIVVTDSAAHFDPTGDRRRVPARDPGDLAPGGAGLTLVKMSADVLGYERAGQLNRTTVVVRRAGGPAQGQEDR
jgi:serine/threonine-protein kinase RsbW